VLLTPPPPETQRRKRSIPVEVSKLNRSELGVLHRLLEEPNPDGQIDGLKWTRFPGLYIQIRGDAQSWVFRWSVRGKQRVMGLGSCSKVTPQDAVDLAAKYMAIVHEGGNPIEVRDAERAAAGLKPVRPLAAAADPIARTFRDAARVYMAKHEDGWTDPLQWAKPLQRYAYPVMADVPISQVSTDHLVKVLEPIWRTKHVTAMKLKSRIAQVLDWAEAERLRSGDNPARAKSVPLRLGNGFRKPVQHFKAIHYPQMAAFWKALAAVDSVAADVVRFMVLTATRPSEALNARWEEIDLAQRIWAIPLVRMKMKKPHRIPLSGKAIEVLHALRDHRQAEALLHDAGDEAMHRVLLPPRGLHDRRDRGAGG
jgi:integrase